MTKKTDVLWLALALACISTPALAYLDPGTGSMIIQVIIGAIAAALLSIKLAWQRIKYAIASFFCRQPKSGPEIKREK